MDERDEKVLAIALGCGLPTSSMQNAYVECFAPEKKEEEPKNFWGKVRRVLTPFSVRLHRTIKETYRYLNIVDQSFDMVVVSNHIRECGNCFETMRRKAREHRDEDQSYFFWEPDMEETELRDPSKEKRERYYQEAFKVIDELPERIDVFLKAVNDQGLY